MSETSSGVKFLANAGLFCIGLGVVLTITIVGAALGLPLIVLGIGLFALAILVDAIQQA